MSDPDMDTSMPPRIRSLFEDASSSEREEMASVWEIFQNEGQVRAQSFDADWTWAKLKKEVNLGESIRKNESSSEGKKTEQKEVRPARRRKDGGRDRVGFRVFSARSVALAAAVTVVALGMWLWTRPVTVTPAKGTRVTTTLPDGSTVELSGGSSLSYRRGFESVPFVSAETRRVRLEGLAFFSVQPSDRPFVVITPNAEVTVLGTKFTVETLRGTGPVTTQVTLRSGRLQFVATGRPAQAVTLDENGRRSRLSGASGRPSSPEPADLGYAEAWRQGGFAVREMPLSATLRKLERQFGTSLRLNAETEETRPMILLYARDADLEQILTDICLLQNLSYHTTSQGYVLTKSRE